MRLQVVTLVLQLHEGVSALEHVSDVISSYLGPPPNLSLARACTFGSTPLLDWIWESSCTTEVDRKPNWTLTNYLRSEIRYGEWQFNEPMVVAAQRGNLAILQWLLDHYSECSVDKTVVEAAAQAGRCNFYTNKLGLSHPTVMRDAAALGHLKVAKLLQARCGLRVNREEAIFLAAANGHLDVVQWLYETPAATSSGAFHPGPAWFGKIYVQDDPIVKDLQTSSAKPATAMDAAAIFGHLDVVRGNLEGGGRLIPRATTTAMDGAAAMGHLEVVKWLHARRSEGCTMRALDGAIANNHFDVMEWLFANRSDGFSLAALCSETEELTSLRSLQWCVNIGGTEELQLTDMKLKAVTLVLGRHDGVNSLEDVSGAISSYLGPPPNLSLAQACTFGSTSLLDWIWASSCSTEADRKPNWKLTNYLRSHAGYSKWQFTEAMTVAAATGDVDVLIWLLEHSPGFKVEASVVEAAAKAGQLSALQLLSQECAAPQPGTGNQETQRRYSRSEVVKWLLERGVSTVSAEECTSLVSNAAENGDVVLVQWLIAHDKHYIDQHIAGDDTGDDVLQWLLARSSDENYLPLLRHLLCASTASGRIDFVKRIIELRQSHAQQYEDELEQAFVVACSSGQLEVVKWILDQGLGRRMDKYPSDVMHNAASRGHLAIAKLLHNQRGHQVSAAETMFYAAGYGHLAVVQWLHELFGEATPGGIFQSLPTSSVCSWTKLGGLFLGIGEREVVRSIVNEPIHSVDVPVIRSLNQH
ncbi:hypothetical protein PHYSODRAFT_332520 [Phytophthora sojae]|uniref:Uncharacterized protein n=1 Tax=Phytophthora sojae (strain P6497) TaxID=1094619 RepID=G4ZIX3_PHYSP|nr:hypothetical protein PHYSODRAFT_332520 [Phytophthora sojae]EGZ18778.1 hypothetical protein PHYSODRAFT_332520 [Phytophthora sojae]|eukprot:XP_009527836.1 hypothetical protein PHYSODRAFT_332520 [Phytophthora sojae]